MRVGPDVPRLLGIGEREDGMIFCDAQFCRDFLVWGVGFGVLGLRFRVWGLGFGVRGLGSGVWDSGFGTGAWGLGLRVHDLGFRV